MMMNFKNSMMRQMRMLVENGAIGLHSEFSLLNSDKLNTVLDMASDIFIKETKSAMSEMSHQGVYDTVKIRQIRALNSARFQLQSKS